MYGCFSTGSDEHIDAVDRTLKTQRLSSKVNASNSRSTVTSHCSCVV